MKQIISFLLLLFTSVCGVLAQSYESLWKDVENAVGKDLPQTALKKVDNIMKRAADDGDDGQLLRALMTRLWLRNDISPDSSRVDFSDLSRRADAETRPEVKAIWNVALGQIDLALSQDTAVVSRVRHRFKAAFADMDILANTPASNYLPLFIIGKDCKVFGDDLLNALVRPVYGSYVWKPEEKAELAGRIAGWYRRHGKETFALRAELDSIGFYVSYTRDKGFPAAWAAYQNVAFRYSRLPQNVETYIAMMQVPEYHVGKNMSDSLVAVKVAAAREGIRLYGKEERASLLRNYLASATCPTLQVELPSSVLYPGERVSVPLSHRNVRNAVVRIYECTGLKASQVREDVMIQHHRPKGVKVKPVENIRRDFTVVKDYKTYTDSVDFTLPRPGVYFVDVEANGELVGSGFVYSSRVLPVISSNESDKVGIRLVDYQTGAVIPHGKVRVMRHDSRGNLVQQSVKEAGSDGEILMEKGNRRQMREVYFAEAGADCYRPSFTIGSSPRYHLPEERVRTVVRLFTDRAIYRPGHTVHFSGLVYTQSGDDVQTVSGMETKVTLYDARNRELASQAVRTDSFGTLSGSFTLPEVCLPGSFRIVSGGGYAYLTVEEYKRPTFSAELVLPEGSYTFGDTVWVEGSAKTWTGMPVAHASVRYQVKNRAYYIRSVYDPEDDHVLQGTVETDADGNFTVPVILEASDDRYGAYYTSYMISADVTAANGETATSSLSLPVSRRRSWLNASWPGSICKENIPSVRVSHLNASGQNLSGKVTYELADGKRVVHSGTLEAGKDYVPAELKDVPSGAYDLTLAMEGTDTLKSRLLLFSESDTRPMGKDVCWKYERDSRAGDSTLVIIGSPEKDVTLFYDLYAGDRRLEHRVYTFSDSLLRFPLQWREEMGDGGRALFAFVRGGVLYTHTADVKRPVPDKRLLLSWSTFRNYLVPGAQETWQLRVTYPDGTPADASLMARLYDASLDVFAKQPWDFAVDFSRRITAAWSTLPWTGQFVAGGMKGMKTYRTRDLLYTSWRPGLLNRNWNVRPLYERKGRASGNGLFKVSVKQMAMADMAAPMMKEESVEGSDAAMEAGGAVPEVPLRSEFAETALFAPALRTDADGHVTLHFTLPQSLTSWNFSALAHTTSMYYGRMDTTVIARKELMVQPSLPRFVRRGDEVAVPVSVRNLTENGMDGSLTFVLTDPETERVILRQNKPFTAKAKGEDVVTFTFPVKGEQTVLACTVSAVSGQYSDGEARYLPVLSDRVEVVKSLPISLIEAGRTTLRIDTLWNNSSKAADKSLTVELTSRPVWYAVSALPALAFEEAVSATEWATRYYAVTLASHLAKQHPEWAELFDGETAGTTSVLARNPELRAMIETETPWASALQNEEERAASLRRLFDENTVEAVRISALDHLRDLQQADGCWSWYPGMPGNMYVTADISLLLARLYDLCGDQDTRQRLDRAVQWMGKKVSEDVKEMKKHPSVSGLSLTHLRYLYVRAMLGLRPDSDARYLMEKAKVSGKSQDLYEKSLLAVVLARGGNKKEAESICQSLREYTVHTPQMGRYFDAARAPKTLRSYRIPAQTATIEALAYVGGKDNLSAAREMRLWLLQSKRTQLWETGRSTADAVYSLLSDDKNAGNLYAAADTAMARPLLYRLDKGRKTVAVNAAEQTRALQTLGYVNHVYTGKDALEANTIHIDKREEGLSYGHVTARYSLPLSSVKSSATGLSVKRTFEVNRSGKWQTLHEGEAVKPGEKVRQIMEVSADRDYDLVTVKSARPAHFVPRHALSGYDVSSGVWAYRAVRDASTSYYVERMPKGTHTLVEEYVVDRVGQYESGSTSVRCVYAPEFGGQTSGFVFGTR